MRPVVLSYTPADDNLTGFLSNATGATWTLTTTTPGDSMAHLVKITNDSATDHSAKTAVLTGTDAENRVQTETLNLPAASVAVTSTKYFRTLTSVVPSATIGADTMDIGWTDGAVNHMVVTNWRQNPFSISVGVDITGTINYDVQHTFDDIFTVAASSVSWFNHSSIVTDTTDQDGNYAFPVRAIRLLINSLTTGATAELFILQGE